MIFKEIGRKKDIRRITESVMGLQCNGVRQINQGFYGQVYLVETNRAPHKIIAKVFKKEHYVDSEEAQLNLLKKYALVAVPEVFGKSYQKDNGVADILCMEYLAGENAGRLKITEQAEKDRFANAVVDNLLAIHAVSNPNGFGPINAERYSPCWEPYYKAQLDALYNSLHNIKIKKFSSASLDLAEQLYAGFDKVFCAPVEKSTLIHGDYNLWNLMADPETNQLTGMIDPMGCCYGDRELELFQLESANGNAYGLLSCYAAQVALSDTFELKKAYYRFWDDIKHLVNVGYCDNRLFENYGNIALDLLK